MDTGSVDTTSRTRNPWGQGDRLRLEILGAASRLLGDLGGEEGLTLRGVARAVGIAPASIYSHFTDKNDLVRAVLSYEYERLLASLRDAENHVDADDPLGRLHARIHAYCTFAMENPGHYRLMVPFRSQTSEDGVMPDTSTLVDGLARTLRGCQAAGHRLRLSPRRAAVMLFVSVHGRVALWHLEPRLGKARDVHRFVDELLSLITEPD